MNNTICMLGAFAILVPAQAFSAASVEKPRARLEKVYENGDMVALLCGKGTSQTCTLEVRIGGVIQKVEMDFHKAGFTPTLNSLSLDVSGQEVTEYSVATGVECREGDIDRIKSYEADSVECTVLADISGNHVSWKGVVVYPIASMSIYTKP